jgi:hypothetical protein
MQISKALESFTIIFLYPRILKYIVIFQYNNFIQTLAFSHRAGAVHFFGQPHFCCE